MTPTETTALAAEIAARFGETGERPRAQIARMIGLMGAEWVRHAVTLAGRVLAGDRGSLPTGGFLRLRMFVKERGPDGALFYADRSDSGVLFAAARYNGEREMLLGNISRRDFFRCFTDRPPKAREPAPRPAPRPKMPAGARATPGNVRRQPVTEPVVYVARRRVS